MIVRNDNDGARDPAPRAQRTLTCPACNGTKRQEVDATGQPVGQATDYPRWPQYAKQGWMECRNCGGQTMSRAATGLTYPHRDNGEPCRHEYTGQTIGRCLTQYACKHCPDVFDIDSSD